MDPVARPSTGTKLPKSGVCSFQATGTPPYSSLVDTDAPGPSTCNGCAHGTTDVIDVDKCGRVYLRDRNNKVGVFDQAGKRLLTLGQGGEIGRVGGVAVSPSGNIYVTDEANHRIVAFDSAGKLLFQWGSKGNGKTELNGPREIDVAPNGRVYVADRSNRRIQVFESDGKYHTTIAPPGSTNGLAMAPIIKNNKIYAMALGFSGCKMFVMDMKGKVLKTKEVCKDVLREGATGWSDYDAFDVDAEENYYFFEMYESGNARSGYITVTDKSFEKTAHYSTVSSPLGLFIEEYRGYPSLHVVREIQNGSRITAFDARQFESSWVAPEVVFGSSGPSSERLSDPNDMFVSNGLVYVLDRGNDRVAVYDDDGAFSSGHKDIEFDDRKNGYWEPAEFVKYGGAYIIANAQTGRVTTQKITSSTSSEFTFTVDGDAKPISALAVDKSGNLYLSPSTGQTIHVVTGTGAPVKTLTCNEVYPGPIRSILVEPSTGNLVVASRQQVAIIESDGSCHRVATEYHGVDGTFDMHGGEIADLATDNQGRYYVLQNYRLQVFDKNWKLVTELGRRGTGLGEITNAVAVDTAPGGYVFILQSYWGYTDGIRRERVQRWKLFDDPLPSPNSGTPHKPRRNQQPATGTQPGSYDGPSFKDITATEAPGTNPDKSSPGDDDP